jgi:FKBP-type peptidyl-prolyl cis-trans isomerase
MVSGDEVIEEVGVEIEEKKEGEGECVENGDNVVIAYKGSLTNGVKFDSGKDFKFEVGAKDVIKGMDRGVLGMKVGGRRLIRIPSALGYGKRGSAPDIPPDSDLIFDITLTKIVSR